MMSQTVLGLLFAFATIASSLKVPVTVYYESLCPDSAKFINGQIYPIVKNHLKDYIDINWVPFGKSDFHTQGSDVFFNCHHGPNECYGNKVHACAIEHIQANSYETAYTRESLTLEFINCMMKVGKNFDDNVYPGARCARENHISTWGNIEQCANSTEGSQLLKKHGETTDMFQKPLAGVPTVVFNQKYDPQVNEKAMTNFLGTICKYVQQPQPQICAAQNSAVSMQIASILGLLVLAAIKLF